jgi:hypothetical protein
MSNKKQTAVDWLWYELNNQKCWADPIRCANLFVQAKAMEKEQNENLLTFIEGTYSYGNIMDKWYLHQNTDIEFTTKELVEQYYKETYEQY